MRMAKETTIVTEVLVPQAEFKADYTAHNPAKLLGVMLELMKGNWRIPSAAVYTDKIKWDVTGKQTEFYGEWRAREKKDARSTVWNRVIVQGKQDPKTKEGQVTVRVKPKLYTTIKYSTPIDEALRFIYLNTFYKEQLRKYLRIGKKRINDFDDVIRLTLGIEERAAGSLPAQEGSE